MSFKLPDISSEWSILAYVIFASVVFLGIAILIPFLIGKFAAKKFNGNKPKAITGFVLISLAVALGLFFCFGLTLKTIQGYLFTLILLYASYSDLRTRECDDYLSVMILITAFIDVGISNIIPMLVAGVFTAGMFLLVVLTVSDGIGGADIKLASASVFLLGFGRGIIGLIAGLLLAVLINSLNSKKIGFPMIPYLTAAFIPAFFL